MELHILQSTRRLGKQPHEGDERGNLADYSPIAIRRRATTEHVRLSPSCENDCTFANLSHRLRRVRWQLREEGVDFAHAYVLAQIHKDALILLFHQLPLITVLLASAPISDASFQIRVHPKKVDAALVRRITSGSKRPCGPSSCWM